MSPTAERLVTYFAAMTGAQQKCVLHELMLVYWHSTSLADDKFDSVLELLSLNLTPEELIPSPELLAELQRRIAAYEADPTSGLTWEQVVARIHRER